MEKINNPALFAGLEVVIAICKQKMRGAPALLLPPASNNYWMAIYYSNLFFQPAKNRSRLYRMIVFRKSNTRLYISFD